MPAYNPPASAGEVLQWVRQEGLTQAYFSNYGGCLDIFAPGVGIESLTTRNGYYARETERNVCSSCRWCRTPPGGPHTHPCVAHKWGAPTQHLLSLFLKQLGPQICC
jgi:subtilisin family serine protease